MTRRPKKAQALRKTAKTVKRAKKIAKKSTRPSQSGSLDDFISAGARALGLKIDKAWLPMVRSHLEVTLRHGALVATFALPDETDPAPVFEA